MRRSTHALLLLAAIAALAVFWLWPRPTRESAVAELMNQDAQAVNPSDNLAPAPTTQVELLRTAAAPAGETVVAAPGEEARAQIASALESHLTYHGVVLDAGSNKPLAGVHVGVHMEWSSRHVGMHSTMTDEAGHFGLNFEPNEHLELRLSLEGYGAARGRMRRGHETPEHACTFYLARSALLTGTVKTFGGEPLYGAEVHVDTPSELLVQPLEVWALGSWIKAAQQGERKEQWSAIANARGEFRIDGLPSGIPLHVQARHEATQAASERRTLGTLLSGESRSIVLTASPPASICGRVVDQDGKPVKGVSMWLMPAASHMGRYLDQTRDEPTKRTQTDDDGCYHFKEIPPGVWRIGPSPSALEPGSSFGLFEAPRPRRTDAGGRWPGEQHDLAPWSVCLELASGEQVQGFDLNIPRGVYLRGQVLDDDGKPIRGAEVTARAEGRGITRRARSSEDGTFVIGPVTTAVHEVSAADDSYHSEPESMLPHQAVLLRIETAGGRIRGRVTFRGQPVEGASVVVERIHPKPTYERSMRSRADGSFWFSRVASGEYGVRAGTDSQAGVAAIRISTDGPTEEVEIELQELVPLRVRYLGAEPLAMVVARRSGVTVTSAFISQGIPAVLHMPAGRATVEVYAFATAPEPRAWDAESARPALTREITVDAAGTTVELP